MKSLRLTAIVFGLAAAIAAAAALLSVRRAARSALASVPSGSRPLRAVALPPPDPRSWWGGTDVVAMAVGRDGVLAAGASGVWLLGEEPHELPGLPHLRVAALAAWRRDPVAAPEAGGLYRWHGTGWEELLSGWGRLHVRVLREAPTGELFVGCREGVFVAAAGGAALARWDAHPVRDLALVPGGAIAGGEEGLWHVEARRVRPLASPDPWIERVGVSGDWLAVVTASGLAMGRLGSELRPVAGGGDVVTGVWHDGTFAALSEGRGAMLRVDPGGSIREERIAPGARRLLAVAGELFASTDTGLLARGREGWDRVTPEGGGSLPGPKAHVGAIAVRRGGEEILVGLFDGGLVRGVRRAGGTSPASIAWNPVGGEVAWGVNALLPVGEATYVASLRGTSRLEEGRLVPLPGPGAAFSLAATPSGVAVGYGQGVMLGHRRMLSAFHGLPGNQALALASSREPGGPVLVVGTPSGLGSIRGERVGWRVTREDGTLPHPWVTAVLPTEGGSLIVGTYGGGLARRDASGRMAPFPETAGWKVNAGALAEVGGVVLAGTDGGGLKRLRGDGRFEALAAALPSDRVTALAATTGGVYVGTDEGIAFVELPLPHRLAAGATP